MIQEEFSRLMSLYQEATEGKAILPEEIFQKSLEFIENLKREILTGSPEDKQAAVRMMNELYQHMKNHTKTMSEKSGITEEELIAKSENSANFTREQWKKMQDSKQRLASAGEELVRLLKEEKSLGDMQAKPKAPKVKKAKKSHWMRS